MIIYVATAAHLRSHKALASAMPWFRRMPYELLLPRGALPAATYIFTDFDRLNFWSLELAAHVYRQLQAAGCRVLNDPARVLQRLELLRRLNREGINDFKVWSAYEAAQVDRFPVFLRTISAHRGVLSNPLADAAALARTLEWRVAAGYPISDLMIVEYRAEPYRDDLFRKPSVYRVGDRMVACPSVHQGSWRVKSGSDGVASEQDYRDDLERVRTNPYADQALRACEAGAIEFGRADIGVSGGRTQIYEINTNPTLPLDRVVHPVAARVEAFRESNAAYRAALLAIDTPAARGRVKIGALKSYSRPRRFLGLDALFRMP